MKFDCAEASRRGRPVVYPLPHGFDRFPTPSVGPRPRQPRRPGGEPTTHVIWAFRVGNAGPAIFHAVFGSIQTGTTRSADTGHAPARYGRPAWNTGRLSHGVPPQSGCRDSIGRENPERAGYSTGAPCTAPTGPVAAGRLAGSASAGPFRETGGRSRPIDRPLTALLRVLPKTTGRVGGPGR